MNALLWFVVLFPNGTMWSSGQFTMTAAAVYFLEQQIASWTWSIKTQYPGCRVFKSQNAGQWEEA